MNRACVAWAVTFAAIGAVVETMAPRTLGMLAAAQAGLWLLRAHRLR